MKSSRMCRSARLILRSRTLLSIATTSLAIASAFLFTLSLMLDITSTSSTRALLLNARRAGNLTNEFRKPSPLSSGEAAEVAACSLAQRAQYTQQELAVFFPPRDLKDCRKEHASFSRIEELSNGTVELEVRCSRRSMVRLLCLKTPKLMQRLCLSKAVIWTSLPEKARESQPNLFRMRLQDDVEVVAVRCGRNQAALHLRVAVRQRLAQARKQRRRVFLDKLQAGGGRHSLLGASESLAIVHVDFDSVSRAHFHRVMKRSVSVMRDLAAAEDGGGHELFDFDMHNVIADNTVPNLWPYLYGGSSSLFEYLHEAGFVSSYVQDDCKSSLAISILDDAFKKNPADHCPNQAWCMAHEAPFHYRDGIDETRCLGHKASSEHALDYLLSFDRAYRHSSRFSFAHLSDGHEVSGSVMRSVDAPLAAFLRALLAQPDADSFNTIVIVSSDHGMRYGGWRSSEGGFLEHKLPTLMMLVPRAILRAHPELAANLRSNSHLLTTKLDLQLTLKHLLLYPTSVPALHQKPSPLASSLLEALPRNRTCRSAGVPLHYCSCLQWRALSDAELHDDVNRPGRPSIRGLAQRVVAAVNEQVRTASYCVPVRLDAIVSAHTQHDEHDGNDRIRNFKFVFTTSQPELVEWEASVRLETSSTTSDATHINEDGFQPQQGNFANETFTIGFVNRPSEWPRECRDRALKDGLQPKYCVCGSQPSQATSIIITAASVIG